VVAEVVVLCCGPRRHCASVPDLVYVVWISGIGTLGRRGWKKAIVGSILLVGDLEGGGLEAWTKGEHVLEFAFLEKKRGEWK